MDGGEDIRAFPALVKIGVILGVFERWGAADVTIGQTLMGNPKLLLLDEPAEGLAPLVVRTLRNQVLKLKDMGETVLVSEQNLNFATRVSDRAYVISKGTIHYQGSIKELFRNEEVKKKYMMI